ncbi:UDP-2,4-diacetamido-2,4,6-trideoxy-beta-L-altropyranose hydrolase [Desulfobotulus alkaliphilus]|uniref:UDP-2,4-diacetamido-2,4, 6-trideoxy-beta-L-altropyranose hydrolase n=1 Tax=Desulfobotulus alkaliphilus TaxID=622671 RepID=A0A562RVC9_9BACT|nr:UDP-2,4-diacetamido-2,4,6-trideoxy-beta-L-altropyranose hydrolase [Desulfobotulus alkaliphilus]TWI72370.1 UDP-2,4-diacetamido-2,4,6-trideoxy-beta-L-altropyranose hydrolase [Desulfobotulus alkaliphilus]
MVFAEKIKKPCVIFRTDASQIIGTGHVMRCLTLASEFKKKGIQCHFVCKNHPGNLTSKIQEQGFTVHLIPLSKKVHHTNSQYQDSYNPWLGSSSKEDAAETLKILKLLKPLWVVLDHYSIGSQWERQIRPFTSKIMVLDDLANRTHDCDILLDPNRNPDSDDYKPLTPSHCTLLLGSAYVLLREEFINMQAQSLERRNCPALNNILITMGGTDPNNNTGRILKYLQESPSIKDLNISVVLGSQAPHLKTIQQQIKLLSCTTQLYIDTKNMATIMAENDLAISACSSTSWECCYMGLPAILLVTAENQKFLADSLKKNSSLWIFNNSDYGISKIPEIITELKKNNDAFKKINPQNQSLIDGRGKERIIDQIKGLNQKLKK